MTIPGFVISTVVLNDRAGGVNGLRRGAQAFAVIVTVLA
jgi:hypothetical protein